MRGVTNEHEWRGTALMMMSGTPKVGHVSMMTRHVCLFMGALILSIFRPRGEELRPFLSRGDDDGTIRSRVANGRQAFRDQRGVPIRSDTMLIPAINQSL